MRLVRPVAVRPLALPHVMLFQLFGHFILLRLQDY